MPGENDPPGEFLNTCEEWHAFGYGIMDAITFPRAGVPYERESLEEPHYYRLGGYVGRAVTILIGVFLCYLIVAL